MTPLLWQAALALAAGGIVGRLHFRAIRAGADALVLRGAAGRAIALTAARFGLTIAFLAAAALAGPAPLLAAALGFWIGRAAELRAAGRAAETTGDAP